MHRFKNNYCLLQYISTDKDLMVKYADLKAEFDELKSNLPSHRSFHCPLFDECQAGPYTRQRTLNEHMKL